MKLDTHTLRTLKFDISFFAQEKVFDLHKQISKLSNNKIYSVINKVCDEELHDRRVFTQIEQLEIDLGSIPYAEIDQLLPNKLYDLFKQALKHQLAISNYSYHINEPSAVQATEHWHDAKLLLIFLQQGILPWWAANDAGDQLEPIFLKLLKNKPQETIAMIYSGSNVTSVIQRIAYQFSDVLLAALAKTINPQHAQELIQYSPILIESASLILPDIQHDKKAKWKMILAFLNPYVSGISYDKESLTAFIIDRLGAESNIAPATLLVGIRSDLSNKRSFKPEEKALQAVVEELLGKRTKKSQAETSSSGKAVSQDVQKQQRKESREEEIHLYAQAELPGMMKANDAGEQNSLKIMTDLQPFINELFQLRQYDRNLYENIVNFTIQYNEKWLGNSTFDIYAFAFFNHLLTKPLPSKQAFELLEKTFRKFGFKPGKMIDKQRLYADDMTSEKNEAYYIENAGLVLLNPFLPVFYEKVGLMDKKGFISKYDADKAIHLLQFLVDGKESHAEHLLLLNKILCGRDIHEPVEKEMRMSETEKEISISLLNAVINNWPQLKNSSVATLRAEFLQRKGKLRFDNGEWLLRVEHNGRSDYLLDTLPWSFAMIKNSWMTEILNAEWT